MTSTLQRPESPFAHLGEQEREKLGKELDAIHDEVFADLGDRDRAYIKKVISVQRQIVVAGRVLLLGSRSKTAWVLGTACLGMAKILENMEIGHNVMHGQWDWMNDPDIHSSKWDWDTASTAESWRHSHNFIHHTYTNIRGKDKDLGYEIMRIDPNQKWSPRYLRQPSTTCCLRCCSSGAWRCTTWISRPFEPARSRGRRCVRTSKASASRRAHRSLRTTSAGR